MSSEVARSLRYRLRQFLRSRSKFLKSLSNASYLCHLLIIPLAFSEDDNNIVCPLVFSISRDRWHSQTSRLYNEGPQTRCNFVPNIIVPNNYTDFVSILKLLRAISKAKKILATTLALVESSDLLLQHYM